MAGSACGGFHCGGRGNAGGTRLHAFEGHGVGRLLVVVPASAAPLLRCSASKLVVRVMLDLTAIRARANCWAAKPRTGQFVVTWSLWSRCSESLVDSLLLLRSERYVLNHCRLTTRTNDAIESCVPPGDTRLPLHVQLFRQRTNALQPSHTIRSVGCTATRPISSCLSSSR